MSNINRLDRISTVEDLTDAAAAVVEGGATVVGDPLNFDSFQATRPFVVSRGGSVKFTTISSGGIGGSGSFTAVLKNTTTGRATPRERIAIGPRGLASWTNVRGGNYVVQVSDRQDGFFIRGSYTASAT